MSRYPPKPAAKKAAGKKKAAPKKAAAKPASTTARRGKKAASEASWAGQKAAQAAERAANLERLEAQRQIAERTAASAQSAVNFNATISSAPRRRGLRARFAAWLERTFNRLIGAKSAE